MIQAKDLRIGNIVWKTQRNINNGEIENVVVTANANVIKGLEMHPYLGHNSATFLGYNPMPLTPEILKKCGFVMDYDGVFYLTIGRKCLMVTVHDGIEVSFQSDIGCQAINLQSEIESLHQLQNLTHALTQTELQIQL